jgi:hypothetical protein
MTPEDVLLEAIAAASLNGDRPELRRKCCRKLRHAIEVEETTRYRQNSIDLIKNIRDFSDGEENN